LIVPIVIFGIVLLTWNTLQLLENLTLWDDPYTPLPGCAF
jgi:hypothetical protein